MLAPAPASPESAGMSKAALDRLENHLKQRYIESGRFPGTQLLIYRRGKIVHSTVQGFADLERKAPMKDDTIFRIYSMTKPITSVRSEEHTSELQSHVNLVCRLLLEKQKCH